MLQKLVRNEYAPTLHYHIRTAGNCALHLNNVTNTYKKRTRHMIISCNIKSFNDYLHFCWLLHISLQQYGGLSSALVWTHLLTSTAKCLFSSLSGFISAATCSTFTTAVTTPSYKTLNAPAIMLCVCVFECLLFDTVAGPYVCTNVCIWVVSI